MLLLWGFLPVLAAACAVALLRRRTLLARFGERRTVRRLSTDPGLGRRVIRGVVLLAGSFFLVLALARPQWGQRSEAVTRRGVDVMIALDVSLSMLAEDVSPSRLGLARAFVADLARRLEGNRIGLIGFAGSAFVQCPLTLDDSAVRLFLETLEPDEAPDPGSSVAEAISTAVDSFPAAWEADRALVVISDGEDHAGGAEEAARLAANRGITVYTVGVGTPAGGPIPLRSPAGEVVDYKKDPTGRVVTSRQDPHCLERVAGAGGGRFLTVSASLEESARLAEEINRKEKAALSSRLVTTRRERFQVPMALALLLLLGESFFPDARRRAEGT